MKGLSLTQRFVIWFVLVSLLPILLIGFSLLTSFEAEMRKTAEDHVSAIADRKADDINNYLDERARDAAVLASEAGTLQAMRAFVGAYSRGGAKSAAYRQADARYRSHFKHFAEVAEYYDVFLISPQGIVVYSNARAPDFGTNLVSGPYRDSGFGRMVRQTISTLQGNISDFDHYAPLGGKIAAFITQPLVADGKLEGVLALQFDNRRVWEVLTNNVGLGASGETVVARPARDGAALVVAPLRFDPDATLKRRILVSGKPIQFGLRGQRGSGVEVDYRGTPVVAAWRYLPRMGWGMVVKTDTAEALAPVFRMRLIALAVLGLTLLAAVLGAFFLSRGIANPLKKLSAAAKGLAAGNLDERVVVEGRDEVAQLGLSFNVMAGDLAALDAQRREAQSALQEVNSSLELRVEERTATLAEVAAQLKREREFAETLINAAPAIVLLMSPDGRILLVNRYFEDLAGYKLDEIRGKDWIDIFVPLRDRARIRNVLTNATHGTPTRGNINLIVTRSGEERLIEWFDSMISGDAGEAASLLSVGMDITESRALEQAVLVASRHNQSLLRLIKDIELAETSAEVIAALRQEISATLGYSDTWITLVGGGTDLAVQRGGGAKSDIETDPFLHELAASDEVVVIGDMRNDARVSQDNAALRDHRTLVHVPLRLSGQRIGAIATGTFGAEGVRLPAPEEIDYLVAAAHHVAVVLDRIEFTRALNLSQKRLNEAQRMARIGSWERDLVTNDLEWSDEVYHIVEWDKDFDTFIKAIHRDDQAKVDNIFTSSLATHVPLQVTHRLIMPDGRIKWVEEHAQSHYDKSGKPIRMVGTIQDVTERMDLTQALSRSEAGLREAQRVARMGSWEIDLARNKISWSDEIFNILERDKDHYPASQKLFRAAIPEEDLAMVDNAYQIAMSGGAPWSFTHRLIMPDGRIKWVEEFGQTSYDDAGKPLRSFGTVQDVTERMEFTEALSQAQQMARVGSWELDLVNGKLNWSDEIFHMFEIDKTRFSASYDAFLAVIHPEDRAAVDAAYNSSVANRQPYRITHRLRMPDGRIKWVEERGRTLYDDSGKPRRSTGTMQDISERVATEDQLRRSLTEKETLLREIHHRVKNNLQIVSSLLYFQAKKVRDPGDLAVMKESRDQLRAMILVHETLYQSGDLSRISFGGYVKTLVSQLADAHGARQRHIDVLVESGDFSLPIETALPSGMIVCELVINAFKYAFPDGRKGEVVVGIRARDGNLLISVSDNGVGLPEGFEVDSASSFGWQLINGLSLQIGGSVALKAGRGANITISFPYTEVVQ